MLAVPEAADPSASVALTVRVPGGEYSPCTSHVHFVPVTVAGKTPMDMPLKEACTVMDLAAPRVPDAVTPVFSSGLVVVSGVRLVIVMAVLEPDIFGAADAVVVPFFFMISSKVVDEYGPLPGGLTICNHI